MFFREKIKQSENVCTCLFFCSRNRIIQIKRIVHISIVPICHSCALKSHTPPRCSLSSLIVQQDSCFGHVLPSPLNRLRMFQTLPIISRGHDKMLQPGAPSVFMVSRRSPLGLMGPQRGGGGSPLLGDPMSLMGDWSIPSSPGTFVLYKKNNHVLFFMSVDFFWRVEE